MSWPCDEPLVSESDGRLDDCNECPSLGDEGGDVEAYLEAWRLRGALGAATLVPRVLVEI